jgi:hypothetical protein
MRVAILCLAPDKERDIDNHFTITQLVSQILLSSPIFPVVLPHMQWQTQGVGNGSHDPTLIFINSYT